MKPDFFLFVLLLATPLTAGAEGGEIAARGRVVSNGPVAGAYVVVEETGGNAATGADGGFSIELPAPGDYTITVSASGFEPFGRVYSLPTEKPIEVVLAPETIEMGTVEVTAERGEIPSKSGASTTITREELERKPVAGDFFNALDQEEGVVVQGSITDPGYGMTGTNWSFSSSRRSFSVYGADSDFNTYYYDYIRIPSNRHYDSGESIIPLAALSYLQIYKGIAPIPYGPGIGGFFRAVPDTDFEKDSSLEVSPSSERIGLVWKRKFGPQSGLLLTADKSLTELTVPVSFWFFKELYSLMGLNIFDGPLRTIPSSGDLSARFFAGPLSNRLTLDAIAYYDYTLMGIDMLGQYDLTGSSFPYFAAVGGKWAWAPREAVVNTLDLTASYQHVASSTRAAMDLESFYNTFAEQHDIPPEEMAAAAANTGTGHLLLDEQPRMAIFAAEGRESFTYLVGDSLALTPGIVGRYSFLEGAYRGAVDMEMSFFGLTMSEHYDIPEVTYREHIGKLHGFLVADYVRPSYELKTSGGYTWFPLHSAAAPSVVGEAKIDIGKKLTVAPRAGWSVGSYDELAYLERKLNEEILGTSSRSSFADLPSSISGSVKISYAPGEDTVLRLSPYFSWYYNLSGLALYAAYRDPYRTGTGQGDIAAQTEMLDPDLGYSAGAGLSWVRHSDPWSLEGDYLLAFTRYHQRQGVDPGWFAPNTDIRHTFKGSVSRALGKGGLLTASLDLYLDKPFTPERVVDPVNRLLEKESFNSARDLVPRFSLGLVWEWDSKWHGLPGRYNISCRNLLAFMNPVLEGMREGSTSTAGASTSVFSNRQYHFFRTDLLDIVTNMEISVGGTYRF